MDYLTLALLLFTLGVVMLFAEVLLPTGGLLVVVALLFFGVGVSIIFARGTTTEAVVAMAALAVGLPAAGYVAVAAYRRMSIGSELDEAAAPLAVAGLTELEALKSRTGKTVSPMRPSGTVEFDGRRIDAMSEGVMLDAGVWVRCVEVKGGKVIVRQMESPPDLADVNPDARPAAPAAPPESPPPPRRPADDFDLDLGLDR